jgi:hypothetical protein
MSDGITPLTPEQVAQQEASAAYEGYVHRVIEEADVEANVITGGLQDETISSRLARDAEAGHVVGEMGSKILDIFQKDHGATAIAADLERAKTVEQIESSDPAIKQ